MASIRLGDLLVKAKVISDSQLKAALAEQQKWGGRLGELLVRMNFLTEDMLVKALSKQMNVPAVNLEAIASIPSHLRAKVPADVARDLVALPLQVQDGGKTLLVVMAEPQNLKHLDTLRSVSRARIVTQLAGRQAIARAFARFYDGEAELGEGEDASFKLVNAQGQTMIKNTGEIRRPEVKAPPPAPAAPPPRQKTSEVPVSAAGKSPSEQLRAIEEAQRKEVNALKGLVDLMIAKGVFTREEYLAKVKR